MSRGKSLSRVRKNAVGFTPRLLLAVVVVLIVVGGLVALPGKKFDFFSKGPSKANDAARNQVIPEMTEILGPDQNLRLKAGRRLVERVGVENALEILKNSPLPNTGEGHLVVHQVGFYAYKKYGVDSILHCKDYFLYACYHGAIIEAASKEGFEAIKKMTDRCKESPGRYFQCLHAAGHSIMAIWNYDLPEALKTCDQLYDSESVENLSSCHNGAFMENLFGVHDFDTGKVAKRDWLSPDIYFPCTAFSEKYQRGCWLNQAARIYQLYHGDLAGSAQACRNIGNDQYTEWCLDNLSRQIHAMTNGDIGRAFALCQTMGTDWRDRCIVVNAGAYYSVGGRNQAIDICRLVISESKESCYQNIIGQVHGDLISAAEKVDLCGRMEPPFNSTCLQSVKVL